uniref:Uncharacterized protein n=1 Tax=Sphaerodactylus townsendi TaxID=933632 RepID=A0ACB8EE65_9SAUR
MAASITGREPRAQLVGMFLQVQADFAFRCAFELLRQSRAEAGEGAAVFLPSPGVPSLAAFQKKAELGRV